MEWLTEADQPAIRYLPMRDLLGILTTAVLIIIVGIVVLMRKIKSRAEAPALAGSQD